MKKESTISRQRQWQKKMLAQGNCIICGEPQSPRSSHYCESHRIRLNAYQRERRHKQLACKRRYFGAKGYTETIPLVENCMEWGEKR